MRVISSYLGCSCQLPESDDNRTKVDFTIKGESGTIKDWKWHPVLNVQLKATSQDAIKGDFLHFKFSRKDLVSMRKSSNEIILAILTVSDNPDKWVQYEEDYILLENKVYWFNPKTMKDFDSVTDNVTIKIPVGNRLTINALGKMMDTIGRGGELGHVL